MNLLTEEIVQNPYPTYARLQQENPVCRIQPGGWLISRYEDVMNGLRNYQVFTVVSKKDMVSPSRMPKECQSDLFMPLHEPPEYHKRRSILTPPFTHNNVVTLGPFIHETAKAIIKEVSTRNDFEFLEHVGFPFAGKVLGHVTGLSGYQTFDEVREWVQAVEQLSVDGLNPNKESAIQKTILKQKSTIKQIIKDVRKNNKEVYLAQVVNAKFDDRDLTTDELVNIIELIIRAGYQTAAQFSAVCFKELCENKNIRDVLIENHNLIPAFVDEMLRLHPITPLSVRHACSDITVHGETIRKGETVCFGIAAANRDPSIFENPNEIDLTRNSQKEHFGFGYGPHICLGLHLARLEIEILVEHILPLTCEYTCQKNKEIDWIKSLLFRGFTKLKATKHR